MVNGTDAKDIACYFFEKKGWKVTSTAMKKTVPIAKRLLVEYSKEQIIYAIDLYTGRLSPKEGIYSLGFLLYVMKDAVKLQEEEKKAKLIEEYKKKKEEENKVFEESDNNGSNRNKEKVLRRNKDTRFRKEFDKYFTK